MQAALTALALAALVPTHAAPALGARNDANAPDPSPVDLPIKSMGYFDSWGSESDYLTRKYGNVHPSIVRRGMVERQEGGATGQADLTNIGPSYTVEVEIG